MNSKEIKVSQKHARSIIKHHAKSFFLSSQFLPKQKRIAAYSVYAFCRYADNIVDNPRNRSTEEVLRELENFRDEVELSFKYKESEHPVLKSFAFIADKYDIPKQYAMDLLDGVKMDLEKNRYETFDELYLFCYRVASVVGLMMTYILGFNKNENTLEYAEKLGIAMQLTNILRDIKEDKQQNRIYIPLKEMQDFGVSEFAIMNEKNSDELRELIKFQVDRAWNYYLEAEPGIKMLDKDSRFAIYAASRIYSGILNIIQNNNFNPFQSRAFVPNRKKAAILLKEVVKTKLSFS